MKICFIALSRKRARYFRLLAKFTPESVFARVVFGVAFNRYLAYSLFANPKAFPWVQVEIHVRRQSINYPRVFRFALIRCLVAFVVRWVESCRMRYYEAYFAAFKFDAVAVWNGQKIPYSAVVLAAQNLGVKVWYFENGVLPGTTTVDPVGVNAQGAVSRCPADYPELPVSSSNRGSGILPIVLIPLQVDSDTQVVVNSPWVKDNAALVSGVVSALQALNIACSVVVREHPLARQRFIGVLPAFARLDNHTSLSQLLDRADLVVTMNSTVGLEAVQLNKSVIVTAEALYGVRDVVKRAGSYIELKSALSDVLVGGWRPARAGSFVESLIRDYCIAGDWRSLGDGEASHCVSVWRRLSGEDGFA